MPAVWLAIMATVLTAWTVGWWTYERRLRREMRYEAAMLLERQTHELYRRTGNYPGRACQHVGAVEVWTKQSLTQLGGPGELIAWWCAACETRLEPGAITRRSLSERKADLKFQQDYEKMRQRQKPMTVMSEGVDLW